MNKRFFSTIVWVSLVLGATPCFAQATKQFDSDLESFKKKIAEAKAVPSKDKPEPALEVSPLTSPLGPAGSLPLKKPATSNALAPSSPEELQARMDAEAAEQMKKLEQETFDNALKQLMPMTPEQIRKLYDRFEENRAAAEAPIKIPETKTRVQTISLEPDQAPPVIHMVPGYVTTVSVLDASGAPWPVQDISFAGEFDITPPEAGGNIFRITPNTAHGVGNMSVRLVDLTTPVIFTLTTSIDSVDYRFEARMTKNGPLAKTPIIEFGGLNTVAGTDSNLVAVLDGTIPQGAEKLAVQGVDGRTSAWRLSGRVYLKTPLSLLSPAWDSSVASSDGTTVYTMNDTPVILLSDDGRMVRAHIATADEVTP